MIRKIITLANLSKILLLFASIGVLIMLVVTTVDVLSAKLFNYPVPGATELISAVMPITVFGFLLEAQIRRKHIIVDVFTCKMPQAFQIVLKIVAWSIVLFLSSLITWHNIPIALRMISIREHTAGIIPIPLYPARIMIVVAMGLLSLQLIKDIIGEIMNFVQLATKTTES